MVGALIPVSRTRSRMRWGCEAGTGEAWGGQASSVKCHLMLARGQPLHIAVEAHGARMGHVSGVTLLAVADGGVAAVAGEHDRLRGQRQQEGHDALEDRLEVAA